MAGGVQSFLNTAITCAAKVREAGADPRIETQMIACQEAVKKALSTYGKKKGNAKASLKKLNDALDQVKKCLEAVPVADLVAEEQTAYECGDDENRDEPKPLTPPSGRLSAVGEFDRLIRH